MSTDTADTFRAQYESEERDAFRAVFSFLQTLDGLSPDEVPNIDKVQLNVWEFVHEVVAGPKAEEGGRKREDDEDTSTVAGAA
jgi:hypothetical protein